MLATVAIAVLVPMMFGWSAARSRRIWVATSRAWSGLVPMTIMSEPVVSVVR